MEKIAFYLTCGNGINPFRDSTLAREQLVAHKVRGAVRGAQRRVQRARGRRAGQRARPVHLQDATRGREPPATRLTDEQCFRKRVSTF